MKSLVSIYKSPKREGMYLYLNKGATLEKTLPEALLTAFGKPVHVFDLLLTPEKKLARVETATVLQQLADIGYYLQMPPKEQDDYLIKLPDEFLSFNDPT
ncbi:YcgL domain-containing protein [Endozoicomonas sp. SCSIO W0465]|uniref:YcgL domain-containing protein n=1 Tax=Endozoicomonas sp. SCSIO W0465 TaxID=2918516 RepID=UPI0020755F08|nr:YcgL domain-containing protein [Endozoicomonas sp. SCSIO W0465]USE35665.1 YcgL domain-containing protein [Endozoicomonas sp. SCSIO W0465]